MANLLQLMDKWHLIMFKLYFQSKRCAQEQKEEGNAVGNSGIEERRKSVKILKDTASWMFTRRVHMNVREANSSPFHIQIFKGDSLSRLSTRRVAHVFRRLYIEANCRN